MPILIIEYLGQRQAGTLNGRVLIGRWPDNTVVIDDTSVSRIHAWIGVQDGRYYVADAGSRAGTFVNGEVVLERHVLRDGDQIRIGPALLKYRTDPMPPADAESIDLTSRPAEALSADKGKFIDCVCGAPLWMPNNFVGKGQCRYCGYEIIRPKKRPSAPPPSLGSPAPIPRLAPRVSPPEVTPARLQEPPPPVQAESDEHLDLLLNEPYAEAPAVEPVEPVEEYSLPDPVVETPTRDAPAEILESPEIPLESPAVYEALPADELPELLLPLDEATPFVEEPIAESDAASPEVLDAAPAPEELATHHDSPSPDEAAEPAPPAFAPPLAREANQVCGVCHAPITVFDEVTPCPSCGLLFHCDCWHENRGCSAYGCPQVNALEENNTPA